MIIFISPNMHGIKLKFVHLWNCEGSHSVFRYSEYEWMVTMKKGMLCKLGKYGRCIVLHNTEHHLNLDKPKQHKKEFWSQFSLVERDLGWGQNMVLLDGLWNIWYFIITHELLTWKVPRFMYRRTKNWCQAFYIQQKISRFGGFLINEHDVENKTSTTRIDNINDQCMFSLCHHWL